MNLGKNNKLVGENNKEKKCEDCSVPIVGFKHKKFCNECATKRNNALSLSYYHKHKKPKTEAQKAYQKEWKEKNKDRLKEYNKRYQKLNKLVDPNRYLYWQTKGRAKRENLPFDIEYHDIVIPDNCPILGIPLRRNIGGKSNSPNSPSIDKIIPRLGYVKGNVQIISMRANLMKNDASPDELRRFASWVINELKV